MATFDEWWDTISPDDRAGVTMKEVWDAAIDEFLEELVACEEIESYTHKDWRDLAEELKG